MRRLNFVTVLALLAALALPVTGCMPTTGRPFATQQIRKIELNKTSKEDVRRMFGEPWRTGIEDGRRTWTYGEYSIHYSRDLVIRFNDDNTVKSYSFSSSLAEDQNL